MQLAIVGKGLFECFAHSQKLPRVERREGQRFVYLLVPGRIDSSGFICHSRNRSLSSVPFIPPCMSPEKLQRHTIDVDTLQRQLSVRQVAEYYGFTLPESFGDSGEQRMRCPCANCTGHDDDRSVSINVSDPFKRFKCFRENYGCGCKATS